MIIPYIEITEGKKMKTHNLAGTDFTVFEQDTPILYGIVHMETGGIACFGTMPCLYTAMDDAIQEREESNLVEFYDILTVTYEDMVANRFSRFYLDHKPFIMPLETYDFDDSEFDPNEVESFL